MFCPNCYEKNKQGLNGTISLVLNQTPPINSIPVFPDTLISTETQLSKSSVGGKILSDEDLLSEDPAKLDFSRCKFSFNKKNIVELSSEEKVRLLDSAKDKKLNSDEEINQALQDIKTSQIEYNHPKNLIPNNGQIPNFHKNR